VTALLTGETGGRLAAAAAKPRRRENFAAAFAVVQETSRRGVEAAKQRGAKVWGGAVQVGEYNLDP
jgi:hypothetical protein